MSVVRGDDVNIHITTPYYRVYRHGAVVVTVLDPENTQDNSWLPTLSAIGEGHAWGDRCTSSTKTTRENWLKKLGEYLVKDVLEEELGRRGMAWPREYVEEGKLRDFPPGYTLITVKRVDSEFQDQDHYLRSPDGEIRFRSPAEFAPHLAWIMQGKPRREGRRTACECIVCNPDGPGQEEISRRYENIGEYFGRNTKPTRGTTTSRQRSSKRSPLFQLAARGANRQKTNIDIGRATIMSTKGKK